MTDHPTDAERLVVAAREILAEALFANDRADRHYLGQLLLLFNSSRAIDVALQSGIENAAVKLGPFPTATILPFKDGSTTED